MTREGFKSDVRARCARGTFPFPVDSSPFSHSTQLWFKFSLSLTGCRVSPTRASQSVELAPRKLNTGEMENLTRSSEGEKKTNEHRAGAPVKKVERSGGGKLTLTNSSPIYSRASADYECVLSRDSIAHTESD